ncbi:MAG: hemolysin family protein [Chitinophagales bacterium]|nr:hemolysin family protein [Chitinophagales bacterium]
MEVVFITGRYNIYEEDDRRKYIFNIAQSYMRSPTLILTATLLIKFLSLTFITYYIIRHTFFLVQDWNTLSVTNRSVSVILCLAMVLSILLLEILPKNLSRLYADRIVPFFSLLIWSGLRIFILPAQFVLSISNLILTSFDIPTAKIKFEYAGLDLERIIQEHQSSLDEESDTDVDTELFENVLYLKNLKVRECMIPRNEITAIEIGDSIETLINTIIKTNHSRILVYEDTIDNVAGYVHHFDLHKHPKNINEILIPIKVVPETMPVQTLMSSLIADNKNIAWVVNEYGGSAGVVTLEDILEEIFGEIDDEFDNVEYIESQLSENEFILSGRLEIDRVNEEYHLDIPEGDYETISGMIVNYIGSIPKENETIQIENYIIKILSVSETKIETIKLTKEKIKNQDE